MSEVSAANDTIYTARRGEAGARRNDGPVTANTVDAPGEGRSVSSCIAECVRGITPMN